MSAAEAATLRLALVGNPNCGKTALFNQLTGSRQKVANYAGVTVERKEGRLHSSASGRSYAVLDLPGAYSLHAASLDEAVTRDVCRGFYPGEPAPDVLVCVVDATNLRLHLRFALEVRQLGKPMIVAVNMMDAALRRGIAIDLAALERELGVPVVETIAVKHGGARALVERIDAVAAHPHEPRVHLAEGADLHAETRRLLSLAVTMPTRTAKIDDALDRWLLHPVFGLLALIVVMFLIFQAVYAWATPMMDMIEAGTGWLGGQAGGLLPEGPLNSLLVDGIIGVAQAYTAWKIRNITTINASSPNTGCSNQRSNASSIFAVRVGMATASDSRRRVSACRSAPSAKCVRGSCGCAATASMRSTSARAPPCFTAMVSTTGTPSSRSSAARSMAMPRRCAASIMLTAKIIGLPSSRTSSAKRRCRRRLVASTTQTSTSGAGSPG